jgi:hypothetical protein
MSKATKIDDETLQQLIFVMQQTNQSLVALKDVPIMTARLEERFAHMQKMFTDNCDDNTKRNESIIKTLSALSKRVDDVEARQDKLSGIYAALIPITGILAAGVTYLLTKALDKLVLIAAILAFMGGPQ